MNTFQKCQTIRRLLVNRAAEVIAYKNWPKQFAVEQIQNFPDEVKTMMKNGKELFEIQPSNLTEKEMIDLGFCKYKEIYLIPLWLFPFLADKIEIECIDGKKVTKKSDIDLDNRSGYGVTPLF